MILNQKSATQYIFYEIKKTNYRVYKDLDFNPGNVNVFLKTIRPRSYH